MHTRMHACAQWLGSVTRRTLGLKPPSMAQSHTRCAAFASATVHCDAQSAVASGARAAAAAASAPAATPSQPARKFTSPTAPQLHSLLSWPSSRGRSLLRLAALGCRQGHEQDHQKVFHRDVPDAISRMFQRCVPNPCGAMGLGRLARAGGRALGLTAGRAVRAVSIVARALQRRGRAVHACFACTGLNQPWPRTRDHADRVLAPSGT
jgi:hypothetical protein